MFRRSHALLAVAWSLLLAAPAAAEDLKADVSALKAAGEPTDGPGLLAYFRKRTLSPGQREKIADLIRRLGDDEYATREKATSDLTDLGSLCRAQLAQALKDPDLEVRRRARTVLTKLGPASAEVQLFAPAARVLAQRRPDGAARVLLDFLPCIEDPEVAEEVAAALTPLAQSNGRPDPAVLAALEEDAPVKRFAAGCALARLPTAEGRDAALKLLKDPDAGVRRRVALALLEAKEKAAIPALIGLLAAAPGEDADAAEEALHLVAAGKTPAPPDGKDARAQEAYRRAWEAWWKEEGGKLDLSRVDVAAWLRGCTLVATLNPRPGSAGSVMGLDWRGKVKWKIDNVSYPVHASLPRRDRVLICEYNHNRVSERDLKGTVLWQKHGVLGLLSAERLPDGNTFLVTRSQLLEVDRDGRHVHSVTRISEPIVAGHRYADGSYAVLTTSGNFLTLSREGAQRRSFFVGYLSAGIGGVKAHFPAKGGVVVPDYMKGQVREYDDAGKLVRTLSAFRPSAVVKLPNGNYLVASRVGTRIYEIDPDGRELSSREAEGRVQFIDRR